ncbi:HNH endonuclease domain-containing protein [Emticicia sp. 17c]|uniref:HNH endonuclease domain-containing protein n=1 Tax=Emticicia sp. 17c TaxID=3127704 RepID=UPI00301CA2F0
MQKIGCYLQRISAFYNEIRNKDISIEINQSFFVLVKKLKETITNMPMRYIGGSISLNHYSIYKYYPSGKIQNSLKQNLSWLIKGFGYFSIPREYFEAFKVLGSFINGTDSIIFKWAEFSVTASGKKLSPEKVINEILKNPVTEREIKNSKELYKNLLKENGQVFCVWTGNHINTYDIHHLIPFSIFKNNDMWNLLPSQSSINNRKRDKIPTIQTLKNAEELIIYYWELIYNKQKDYFLDQVQVSLLGNLPKDKWQKSAFSQLINTSKYLIEIRGYEPWKL